MKVMGWVLILAGSAALAGTADARNVFVPGHYLANGTYVRPHYEQVPEAPVYPGYRNVDPETGAVAPVPYPYGAPYAPVPYGTPYGTPYAPAPGYVPNYGYVPR